MKPVTKDKHRITVYVAMYSDGALIGVADTLCRAKQLVQKVEGRAPLHWTDCLDPLFSHARGRGYAYRVIPQRLTYSTYKSKE